MADFVPDVKSPPLGASPPCIPICTRRRVYPDLCSPNRNCSSCEATVSAFNNFDALCNDLETPVIARENNHWNEVLQWPLLTGSQLMFASTIVALVLLTQAGRHRQPVGWKLTWLIVSFFLTIVFAGGFLWNWKQRRNCRLAEEKKLKEETQIWRSTIRSFCRDHGKREMNIEAQKQRLIYKENRKWKRRQQLRPDRSVSRGRSSKRKEDQDAGLSGTEHPAFNYQSVQDLRAVTQAYRESSIPGLKSPKGSFDGHPRRTSSMRGPLTRTSSMRIKPIPVHSDSGSRIASPETARPLQFPRTPSPLPPLFESPPAHITGLGRYMIAETQKQQLERLQSTTHPDPEGYETRDARDSILPEEEQRIRSGVSAMHLIEPARDRIIARNFPEFLGHLADDEISKIAHGSYSEALSGTASPRLDKGKQQADTPPFSKPGKALQRADPPLPFSWQNKDKRPVGIPSSAYIGKGKQQAKTPSPSPPLPPPKDSKDSGAADRATITPSAMLDTLVLDENGRNSLEAGIDLGKSRKRSWNGPGGMVGILKGMGKRAGSETVEVEPVGGPSRSAMPEGVAKNKGVRSMGWAGTE